VSKWRRRARGRPASSESVIAGVQAGLDISLAVLMILDEVRVQGAFIGPGSIYLSICGPMFGGPLIAGRSSTGTATLRAITLIAGLLLILGQFTIVGPFVSSQSLVLVVSGPLLGAIGLPVPLTDGEFAREFAVQLRTLIVEEYAVRPHLTGE
jgi:hypothetical protein